MIKLSDGGAYLINGVDIVEDSASAVNEVAAKTGCSVTKEEAAKNTIAYGILENHNTSGNMEKLKIKFDKMTSHDITFVGIIQTAIASGLEKFPIPYDHALQPLSLLQFFADDHGEFSLNAATQTSW